MNLPLEKQFRLQVFRNEISEYTDRVELGLTMRTLVEYINLRVEAAESIGSVELTQEKQILADAWRMIPTYYTLKGLQDYCFHLIEQLMVIEQIITCKLCEKIGLAIQ